MGTAARSVSPATVLVALASVACQPDDPSIGDPAIQVRDSAGIRIIENPRPTEGSRLEWRIGPEAALSIGEVDGEDPYTLYFVRDAMRLSDGRIVVANGGSHELRFFDARGSHLTSRGGEGQGPGEFERLLTLWPWPGDSIAAWRAPGSGISVFDTEGSYERTFALADHATTPGFRWNPLSVTRDGAILVAGIADDESMIELQLRGGQGQLLTSLGMHPGSERSGTTRATAYRRGSVLTLWNDLVIVGTNFRYELKAFTTDGRLARIVRRGHELRAPTEAEVLAYVEENARPGTAPDEIRRQARSTPVAEHFPAYGSVASDATGHLWVREYSFPLEARPAPLWTVFDPDGQVLGFVETPRGLVIYEIGADYILGLMYDALGVGSVQLWALERSGDAGPSS